MESSMDRNTAKEVLERFLSFDITASKEVLDEFASLPRAVVHRDGGKENFVYVPGTRKDRVLLVAHADTVWDASYGNGEGYKQTLTEKDGIYSGRKNDCGIGADDRAGCAILWLLKDSGHSLLVVDGEEFGQIGSHHIKDRYPHIFDELNAHSYMIQFDRREHMNYKVYTLPVTQEFLLFVAGNTGYYNSGVFSRTDIVVLCRDICGVNLSIGYYNEHSPDESLVFDEWFTTLTVAEKLLAPEQKRFPLKRRR